MQTENIKNQFEDIYKNQADSIFSFCLFRVSDREQALDITQEVFLRLWRTISTGESVDNHRALLFTIARNLIIDWYRKKKALSLEALEDPETHEPYEPSNENGQMDIETASEGRFLIQSINKLDESYRQAVYLKFVEGLSPPEIADILDISVNAASVRINRGIEKLRKITGYSKE